MIGAAPWWIINTQLQVSAVGV